MNAVPYPSQPIPHPRPRIAVTCAGNPEDVASFSGAPAALLRALRALDVEGLALRGDLGPRGQVWLDRGMQALRLRPTHLRHVRDLRETRRTLSAKAGMSKSVPVIRARIAQHRVRRLAPLSGVLQYGAGFDLPAGIPVVTLEDATFRQVREEFAWEWMGTPPASVIDLFDRQIRVRYQRARACAFMSHWAAASAIGGYGAAPGKVHVVGVGRNHEPPCPDRDWSSPRALFVGLDWERKNGAAVLRAFAKWRELQPDARLDVVGGHPRLDMEGVHGHGLLSLANPVQRGRLEALFAAATFFVMPSIHEPAGIVYAEAQAAGIASIATSSGGAATIVGDAGILVDPHDDAAIQHAMTRLADPAEAARLGALARERAQLFTWHAVAERLLRALEPPGVQIESLTPYLPDS